MPKNLEFLDEEDERRKCSEFKDHLIKFQRELGVENFKVPSIGGKELDLCKLYKAVISRGGSQRVSNNKLWKEIVNEFEIPSSCTSASFTLRNHYNKCLLQYEKKYFLGQSNIEILERSGAEGGASYSNYPHHNAGNAYAIPASYGQPIAGSSGYQPYAFNGPSTAHVGRPSKHHNNHHYESNQHMQGGSSQPASVNPNSSY